MRSRWRWRRCDSRSERLERAAVRAGRPARELTARGQAGSNDAPRPRGANSACGLLERRDCGARHPQPVVLVHGLAANRTVNWSTMSPFLANRGFCVFALTYGNRAKVDTPVYQPGGLKRMQDSAERLGRFVDKVREATGARKVDIVGHSEGSLMPNYSGQVHGWRRDCRRLRGRDPAVGRHRPRRPRHARPDRAGARLLRRHLRRARAVLRLLPPVPHTTPSSSRR